MKTLEQVPEKKKSLFEPTKKEIFKELDYQMWNMEIQGQKPTVEQKLTLAHARREAIFDNLLMLEEIRKSQRLVRTEDFDTLKFIIEQGLLNERGRGDVNEFLQIDYTVKDEALSQIAFLRETDRIISFFEKEDGNTDDEIDSRAKVRKQHASTYEAEWNVS